MGVQHSNPDFLATILERIDVLDAGVTTENLLPFGPEFHETGQMSNTQVVETDIVQWRVQDHFALAVVGGNRREF
jgi:hypothetical protein